MDFNIHSFYQSFKLDSAAAVCSAMLFCMPCRGFCNEEKPILKEDLLHAEDIEDEFDSFEEFLEEIAEPIAEAKLFLQAFLDQLYRETGVRLTVQEACALVKERMHLFSFSPEFKEILLFVMDLLAEEKIEELAIETDHQIVDRTALRAGLAKGKKRRKDAFRTRSGKKPKIPRLSSQLIAGSVETICGALSYALSVDGNGAIMLQDGIRRSIEAEKSYAP